MSTPIWRSSRLAFQGLSRIHNVTFTICMWLILWLIESLRKSKDHDHNQIAAVLREQLLCSCTLGCHVLGDLWIHSLSWSYCACHYACCRCQIQPKHYFVCNRQITWRLETMWKPSISRSRTMKKTSCSPFAKYFSMGGECRWHETNEANSISDPWKLRKTTVHRAWTRASTRRLNSIGTRNPEPIASFDNFAFVHAVYEVSDIFLDSRFNLLFLNQLERAVPLTILIGLFQTKEDAVNSKAE